MNNNKFQEIDITSEELFSLPRGEEGHIVLDDVIHGFSEESREIIGLPDRTKNWIRTKDGKTFLIKTNGDIDEKESYSEFAELICQKLANKAGLEYAKYDIISLNGKKGVITENMVKENEYMTSIEEYIGGAMWHPGSELLNIDMDDMFRQVYKKTLENGYTGDDVQDILKELCRRNIFDVFVGATDRHLENVSVIRNITGEKKIKVAPVYDTEYSLLMDTNREEVSGLAFDTKYCRQCARAVMPKIATTPSKEAKADEIIKFTFQTNAIDMDEELTDFAADLVYCDVDEVLKEVEDDIRTTLPISVTRTTKMFLDERKKMLNDILCYDEHIEADKKYMDNVKEYLEYKRNKKRDVENPNI